MNIMSKPSLKQIKEKFKGAKEVRCLFDLEIYDISEWNRYFDNGDYDYWVEKDKSGKQQAQLFEDGKYAEIISYKEPLYKLTSKEVVHAYENPQWLKDTFKECFETELEINRWIKVNRNWNDDKEALVFFKGIGKESYGFSHSGSWSNSYGTINNTFCNSKYTYTQATDKEVEEALKKEAIKRGYEVGNFKCLDMPNYTKKNIENNYFFESGRLWLGTKKCANCVFINGIWAEIIPVPTYTIPEAESKFNIKIKADV